MSPRIAGFELTKDQIVESGLRLLRDQGIDGLSMRRLAGELGVTPTAIYYYVQDKESLIDLLVEEIYSRIEVPSEGEWPQRLRILLRSIHSALADYPRAVPFLLSRYMASPSGLLLVDEALSWLLDAGFSESQTAEAVVLVASMLIGQIQLEVLQQVPGSLASFGAGLPGAESIEIPRIARISPFLTRRVGPDDFERLIDFLISDIARDPPARKKKTRQTRNGNAPEKTASKSKAKADERGPA